MKRVTSLLVAGAVVFGLAACGDDEVTEPEPQIVVTGVSVTPVSATVEVGATITVAANVEATAGANLAVTWLSSDQAVATVDAQGVVTGVAPGLAQITATSVQDATRSAVASVQVLVPPAINALTLAPPSGSIKVSRTLALVAIVDATGEIDRSVTWASSDDAIATVDANGLVTAVAPGEATITVTSVADGTKTASALITVLPLVKATVSIKSITDEFGVTIDPDAVSGLIVVTLNVDRGDFEIAKVELLMGGQVVGSQEFGAAAAAAAQAQAAAEIAFAFNTAQVAADGVPPFLNVAHIPGARLQLTDASSVSATQVVNPLTFANPNIARAITVSGTKAVNPGTGATWWGGGDLTLTTQPTIYDATPPSTVRFRITAGPEVFSNGKSFIDAPVGAKNVYEAVIPKGKSGSANRVEDASVPISVTSSRIPGVSTKSFSLDNVAPDKPATPDFQFRDARTGTAFFENPVNGWANGSTEFRLDAGALDGGVGSVEFTLNLFTKVAFTGKFVPGAVVSSGADLAESTTDSKFSIGVTELKDALGNETTLPTVPALSNAFGVDKTRPAISSVKPSGVAVLNPASDEVYTFKIKDSRSGLDIDEAGVDADERRFFKAKLGGSSVGVTVDGLAVPDGTTASIPVSLIVSGADDAANDGSLSVTGQMIDQAGNVAELPALSTTLDNTRPSVPITGPPQASIDANGASEITVIMSGSINDANGISSATVTGFIGEVQFTVADANIDIISLPEGSFSASFTLKSKGAGTSSDYTFKIVAKDNARNLSGSLAGRNVRNVPPLSTTINW